jgi:hypothetical protein
VDALQHGSVDDDELSICCDNCLLSTFELFASINEGDELRSTITFIFTGGINDELSITVVVVVVVSVEVFSPLVEQIAEDGDERF